MNKLITASEAREIATSKEVIDKIVQQELHTVMCQINVEANNGLTETEVFTTHHETKTKLIELGYSVIQLKQAMLIQW